MGQYTNNMDESSSINLIKLLLIRLERISVDSHWAHRASGIRGALLAALDEIENDNSSPPEKIKPLIELGFKILGEAARR